MKGDPLIAASAPVAAPAIAVVITTFNHARFLGEAIDSVLTQSVPADQIIVIDDGSVDRPDEVVAHYPSVRLIRQENQGLSAARNRGIEAASAKLITFLDADDVLLPLALEKGIAAHRACPGAAFVFGGHRRVDVDRQPIGHDRFDPTGTNPFRDLLSGNLVAMHATAMFDREMLKTSGGYDRSLRRCEDYDVYLRLSRDHAVACYPDIVAEYRIHDQNMSHDRQQMLETVRTVLDRHARNLAGADAEAARNGKRAWRRYYADLALREARDNLRQGSISGFARALASSVRMSPAPLLDRVGRKLRLGTKRLAPPIILSRLARLRRRDRIPVGRFRMGDFARPIPASLDFGWDRGEPVDRYYVERFLSDHRGDIAGRVLEIGDDGYSRRFGGDRVSRQDILHVSAANPKATIVGDLSQPGVLPGSTFDCIVLTQTLHLIYDMPAALRELEQALKPGGVLLATAPGISQLDRGEWGASWFWSITPVSARRLFGDVFGNTNVAVAGYGNVYAAITMLEGLARSEIDERKLDPVDPAYPVIVAIRAMKNAT